MAAKPLTSIQLLRNQLGAAVRRGDPPQKVEALRLALERAHIDTHLAAIDKAGRRGTMSAEQRETVARLFRYGPAPGDTPETEPESAAAWAG